MDSVIDAVFSTITGTRHTRVSVETMRDWLGLYRKGGFEALHPKTRALFPKTRAERGQPRRLLPEVAEVLVPLENKQSALSVRALVGAHRERGLDHPLAPSTVHRLLSREGVLDTRPGDPVATDRRRFAFRDAADALKASQVTVGSRCHQVILMYFNPSTDHPVNRSPRQPITNT